MSCSETAVVASERAGAVHAGVIGRWYGTADQVPVRRAE